MERELILERLKPVVRDILEKEGAYLIDMNYNANALRILVNRSGGISIDECARLNGIISMALDKIDIIGHSYVLEISSPGLDRPLKTKEDFICAYGRVIDVTFKSGAEIVTRRGTIANVENDSVVLKAEEGNFAVGLSDVVKATICVRF